MLEKLIQAAEKHGVIVKDLGNGHYQLQGRLLVNYYPESRNRTAYIAGTVGGRKHVSIGQAVLLAINPPTLVPGQTKAKRKRGRVKNYRWKLWLGGCRTCYVCGKPFEDFNETTLEHIIPLCRGGLDHQNNRTLSHLECNRLRGNSMPELFGEHGAKTLTNSDTGVKIEASSPNIKPQRSAPDVVNPDLR